MRRFAFGLPSIGPKDDVGVRDMSGQGGWGPFVNGLEPAERLARLRAIRALALVFARNHPTIHFWLKKAEEGRSGALEEAEKIIDTELPAIGRRRLLATYSDLARA